MGQKRRTAMRLKRLRASLKTNKRKIVNRKQAVVTPQVVIPPIMGKPKYSFIAAAIREYHYEDLYNSIAQNNDVPFEVILVGDKSPTKPMPDNFHYIHTSVKPAQCLEIAARHAVGELMMTTGDDLRYPDGFLKKVEYYVNKIDLDKVFMTYRYSFNNVTNDAQLVFDIDIPNSPIVGFSGLFRKDLWHQFGGLDKRFVSCFGETDMMMRYFEYGLNVFIPPDCYPNEISQNKGELTSFARSGFSGRETLNSFWVKSDNTMSKTRLLPVESFIDEDILIKNQGCDTSTGKKGSFKWG